MNQSSQSDVSVSLPYDLLAVGNATVDAFLTIQDANVHCHLNTKTCELCVAYGEKILLEGCSFQAGGNACNVAVGISRLGNRTSLVAEIGDDEFAQKILHSLDNEKVDKKLLIQKQNMGSSFAIGIQFKGERTLFVEHVRREHTFAFDHIMTKWIYLTSLGKEWQHVYSQVVSFITKTGCKLAFNPGTPQLDEGYESIAAVMQSTKVFIVNKQEAIRLSGKSDIFDTNILLQTMKQKGPQIVVITDGENGTSVIDESGVIYKIGIIDCPVIEKTGAGDAFSSGFIAGLLAGEHIQQALQWGTINATSVIGKVGAQPGLLTYDQLIVQKEKYKEQLLVRV